MGRFHGLVVKVKQLCATAGTDAEILSLDAGSRMEGIPALSLWDTIIDVLHP